MRSLVLVSTWGRPDVYARSVMRSVAWMAQHAPSERAFLEAFYLWIYTRRAHESGLVAQIIEEALAFPHAATPEAIQKTLDAFLVHETLDRLHAVTAPTLVLSGGQDLLIPPLYGRAVAEAISGAVFEVWDEEAHQPFQEVPGPSTPVWTTSGARSTALAPECGLAARHIWSPRLRWAAHPEG